MIEKKNDDKKFDIFGILVKLVRWYCVFISIKLVGLVWYNLN